MSESIPRLRVEREEKKITQIVIHSEGFSPEDRVENFDDLRLSIPIQGGTFEVYRGGQFSLTWSAPSGKNRRSS